jgi:hypothetical protein
MSPIIETLLLGAIGSVIGTFLFLFINSYWHSYVKPRINDAPYRGARVDGHWEYVNKFSEKEKQVYTLELTQHADSIKGIYTLTSDISEGFCTSSYAFTGHVVDGYVIGTARPNDRSSIYHAALLLKITEGLDALALKGKHTAITLQDNEIFSRDVLFKRKSA